MKSFLRLMVGAGLAACLVAANAQDVLDQQQTLYNGGTSARTLPGYTVWQSFTAGRTGTLSRIDMGFFNSMSGSGTLTIYSGEGTTGTVLATQTVPIVGVTQRPVTWNAWAVSVPVTAGNHYTFEIRPDAATLPDPYGVAIGSPNPYPPGAMGLNDPSGTSITNFDIVFRTYTQSTGGTGYELNELTLGRGYSVVDQPVFRSVSRHGKYAIVIARDKDTDEHDLLFGDGSALMDRFEDLNGAAGPNLNPMSYQFTSVNDKGHAVARDANGWYFYRHRLHALTPIATYDKGFKEIYVAGINNRENVFGTAERDPQDGEHFVRWKYDVASDSYTGKTLFVHDEIRLHTKRQVPLNADLDDFDHQIGNGSWKDQGHAMQFGAWEYIVGPPVVHADFDASRENDNHEVVGNSTATHPIQTGEVWNYMTNSSRHLAAFHAGGGTTVDCRFIDDAGNVVGVENDNDGDPASNYPVFWDVSGTPHLLMDMMLNPPPSLDKTAFQVDAMDMLGNIYGSYVAGDGSIHPFVLTPP